MNPWNSRRNRHLSVMGIPTTKQGRFHSYQTYDSKRQASIAAHTASNPVLYSSLDEHLSIIRAGGSVNRPPLQRAGGGVRPRSFSSPDLHSSAPGAKLEKRVKKAGNKVGGFGISSFLNRFS